MIGFVIWLTGLSGSGKSTIANQLERELSKTHKVEVLDGDEIRNTISAGLDFSREGIITNNKRILFLSKLIERLGGVAIVPVISPFQEIRDLTRTELNNYFEVFVDCSLEECKKRDVKGLYQKAERGEIEKFIGIDVFYETPANPDIIVDTGTLSEQECVEQILEKLRERGFLS